jgi:hypothetical protein
LSGERNPKVTDLQQQHKQNKRLKETCKKQRESLKLQRDAIHLQQSNTSRRDTGPNFKLKFQTEPSTGFRANVISASKSKFDRILTLSGIGRFALQSLTMLAQFGVLWWFCEQRFRGHYL